jgi:hypothetical protein
MEWENFNRRLVQWENAKQRRSIQVSELTLERESIEKQIAENLRIVRRPNGSD